ncbi:hypothetical protein DXG03_001206 [Asterophora parasitica]|uniref:Uncharacterized protein n=1 Tax=Asterophora parasitica TaxID=117018 RepID=A0A9P7G3F0_9AGAR|nr:hypothetical protein DXG03_001206 [Asterophora parasitica]
MSQLKRAESVFIMPMGEKRYLFVVDTIPDIRSIKHSPPPQVILTYGKIKRAYGRDRLMRYDYKDVMVLFSRDFRLPRTPRSENTLQVTFYRKHGSGYDSSLVSIDQESWAELMRNVTRIDLKRPDDPNYFIQTLVGSFFKRST